MAIDGNRWHLRMLERDANLDALLVKEVREITRAQRSSWQLIGAHGRSRELSEAHGSS